MAKKDKGMDAPKASRKSKQDEVANVDPTTLQKSVFKTITTDLTAGSIQEKAIKLAEAHNEIRRLEDELKTVTKGLKEKLDAQRTTIDILVEQVTNGTERRSVECVVVKDYEKQEKQYVFEGNVIETEPFDESDFQRSLIDQADPQVNEDSSPNHEEPDHVKKAEEERKSRLKEKKDASKKLKADSDITDVVDQNESDFEELIREARALFEGKEYELAFYKFEDALKAKPDDKEAAEGMKAARQWQKAMSNMAAKS